MSHQPWLSYQLSVISYQWVSYQWVSYQSIVLSDKLGAAFLLKKLPTPHTPHPTPYTLHPTPHFPTPHTL
ncbi:MAG: hypothetical protein EWV83_15650 [Microcystis sp. M_OC_Ca_00000000_S217Cul]|nr:MAG: hypothetical protein EWV83_15650 [Microcystis sp. M_OC_Ca_00000000_S217Cul]TRT90258.1 MAG: hypothetical protein EWV66_08775 [Microcystis sp. M_OC_Ca_00000000_C217Col]